MVFFKIYFEILLYCHISIEIIMLNKSNVNNFQIKLDKIREECTQNAILLEKLDNEALEFELQRNHDRYILGLDRFNSLKMQDFSWGFLA